MNKGIHLLLLFTTLLLGYGCSRNPDRTTFTITAKVKNLEGVKVYLAQEFKILDSARIKDGIFTLSSEVLNNSVTEILFEGSDEDIDLLIGGWRHYIRFFVEHEAYYKFVANGRKQIYDRSYQLETNSPLAQAYYQLDTSSFLKLRRHQAIADRFEKILDTLDVTDTLLYRKYDDSVTHHRKLQRLSVPHAYRQAIEKNPNSYLSLFYLSQAHNLSQDTDFYISVEKRLAGKYRETKQAKAFIKALAKVRTDLPVKLDIDAVNVNEEAFRFGDYKNSKAIVVDFCATWCAPCVEVMPEALALEKQLKAKNISYVFLSYDERVKTWEKASNNLGLQHSYRILREAKPYLKEKLHIATIPRYALIDNEGNVLVRDLPSPSDAKFMVSIDSVMNKL
ncbi:MAG: AhpC/TSA family protein [Flavobacteriales bacterium]|nr:MAG: AhpC/TSA family protein [Flavobacteriales bacterium]